MDKWEAYIKQQDAPLDNRTWKAQSNFTLERYIQKELNMYVYMKECTKHVRYQLTKKHNHVGYVFDATKTSDA